MEFNFSTINSDVYYGLDNELNIKEYWDLTSAIATKPELYLIVHVTIGKWINYVGYSYQFTNQGIKIRVLNNTGQQVSTVHENIWSLDSMGIEDRDNHQLTAFHARIVDPRGNTISRKYYGEGFHGFLNSIRFFREVSKYDSIESYLLSKKNKDLRVQYKNLVLEIHALKEKTNHPEWV
jgi:hypothetical protein